MSKKCLINETVDYSNKGYVDYYFARHPDHDIRITHDLDHNEWYGTLQIDVTPDKSEFGPCRDLPRSIVYKLIPLCE
jgi:hypothetical protein